jgi:hypothetical protein
MNSPGAVSDGIGQLVLRKEDFRLLTGRAHPQLRQGGRARERHRRHRLWLGGRIHPQLVWAKLAALVEGAKLATKELYGS